jgi:hypothetical protein
MNGADGGSPSPLREAEMAVLTADEARKFLNQFRYGRPSAKAAESVRRGIEMARELAATGCVRLCLGEGVGG